MSMGHSYTEIHAFITMQTKMDIGQLSLRIVNENSTIFLYAPPTPKGWDYLAKLLQEAAAMCAGKASAE